MQIGHPGGLIDILLDCSCVRTHDNGSIKRANKDNASEVVPLRTDIGVQLKDIKVFSKTRQQGKLFYPGSSSKLRCC